MIAKRDAKKAELLKGEYVSRNGITFATWALQWLKEYKQISLSPNTYEVYEIMLTKHVVSHIGKLPLQKITDRDVQHCINIVSKKVAPTTTKKIAMVTKQCFAQAVVSRVISFNPAKHLKIPKQVKARQKTAFTDEELGLIINAAQKPVKAYVNPTLFPALMLMIETGARRGEILGLQWKNVDADTIKIQDTVVQVHGKSFEKDTPKNNSSIRVLGISEETMALIKGIRGTSPYVFHTGSGSPISPRNFNRRFAEWCIDAGLYTVEIREKKGKKVEVKVPTHTPHELRHTFITNMINNGESIANLQPLTGHATSRVLIEYAHAVPQESKDAMKRRAKRLHKIIHGDVSKVSLVSNVVSENCIKA